MKVRPVTLRVQAHHDADEAIDYYRSQAGEKAAQGFIDALQRTFFGIAHYPAAGSPRYAHELGLPGLRFRPLNGYPHLVFYVERDTQIEVWRILHGERDIPASIRETADS